MQTIAKSGIVIDTEEIERTILEIGHEYGIDDIARECSEQQFKAILMRAHRECFPDEKTFFIPNVLGNMLDVETLYFLCGFYCELCNKYRKDISVIGFSMLTGIDNDTFLAFSYEEPNTLKSEIAKKLYQYGESSLMDRALDSRHIMGIFQVGRRKYAWDMPNVSNNDSNKRALSANELPKLGDMSSNSNRQLTATSEIPNIDDI